MFGAYGAKNYPFVGLRGGCNLVPDVRLAVPDLQGKGSKIKMKASEPGGRPTYKWRLERRK